MPLPMRNTTSEHIALGLAALTLVLVLKLGLLAALIGGLAVYHLTHGLAHLIPHLERGAAKRIILMLISSAIILGLLVGGLALTTFVRAENGGMIALLAKMAEILEHSRQMLPSDLTMYWPQDVEEFKNRLVETLRGHASELQHLGQEAAHAAVHLLFGMIIGAMLALHPPSPALAPFAAALQGRVVRFSQSFSDIVFAQLKIAAINAVFTGIYLAIILPLFGVKLPFVLTLTLLTFVTGMIPVAGNIISNTVIVTVSLGHSLPVALASLAFLVIIHKLEYLLNAKIIGTHIHARAWELLLAILVLESAFGLVGVVAAPIYYAWAKAELRDRGWV